MKRLSGTKLLGAALSGLLAWVPGSVSATPRDTSTSQGQSTVVTFSVIEQTSSCHTSYLFWVMGEFSTEAEAGYHFDWLVYDSCSDEYVVNVDAPVDTMDVESLTLAPNGTNASLDLSGPIHDNLGDGYGTFEASLEFIFDSPMGDGGSYDYTTCVPLEVDEETGEPVAGTLYVQDRLLSSGATRRGSLVNMAGSITMTLPDGSTHDLMTDVDTSGWLSEFYGAVVHQVSDSVVVERCRERVRERP